MSTVLARSFPSSKLTEENRVHSVKAVKSKHSSKRQVQENPLAAQKSHQAPLTTPRKALGNLSNTPWQKTPANPAQAPKSTFKPTKITSSSQVLPRKKTSITTSQKQECHDDVTDIEYMPLQDSKVSGSDVSVAPPMAYFRNLASALKATTTIPPSVLNNLSRQDSPARLSMCIERRPHRSLSGSIFVCDDSGSLLQEEATFEDLPDIPDFD